MDINATLLVQIFTFALFVIFTMKYVWPPISQALEDREHKIADGLAAAERGHRELELAQARASETLKDAKHQAAQILEQANKQAQHMIEAAKQQGREEGVRQIKLAEEQFAQDVNKAKAALREQVSSLAMQGAEKILSHHIDEASNQALLDELLTELK